MGFFLFLKIYLFITFGCTGLLCCAHGLSLVAVSKGSTVFIESIF